jgi:hypothetical protein
VAVCVVGGVMCCRCVVVCLLGDGICVLGGVIGGGMHVVGGYTYSTIP